MNKTMVVLALSIMLAVRAMEQQREFRQPFSDLDQAPVLIQSGVATLENLEELAIRADLKEELKSFYSELESLDGSFKRVMVRILDIYEANLDKPINEVFGKDSQEELYTALCSAARGGLINIAKFLLSLGIKVNDSYSHGNTPLMLAAGEGQMEMVKMLIQRGANVNVQNDDNQTALSLAVEKGYLKVVKILIAFGADVNIQSKEMRSFLGFFGRKNYKYTPLSLAAKKGHTEIVKILIQSGAVINIENEHEDTALSLAIEKGYTEIIELLNNAANE